MGQDKDPWGSAGTFFYSGPAGGTFLLFTFFTFLLYLILFYVFGVLPW
jgi:hypothetical protein